MKTQKSQQKKTKFPPQKPWILVIDFEANCSDSNTRDHEICEFPAVLVNLKTKQKCDEFQRFVKKVKIPKMSKFIKDLTNITDEQITGVDSRDWKTTLIEFEEWCKTRGLNSDNCTVMTCGDWDLKKMLDRQLLITHTILTPFLNDFFGCWNNVKRTYSVCMTKKFGKRNKRSDGKPHWSGRGMAGMLKYLNIPLVGHHHSGIDDSRNIASIGIRLFELGWDVSIPNRIREVPFHYQIPEDLPYWRTKRGKIMKRINKSLKEK